MEKEGGRGKRRKNNIWREKIEEKWTCGGKWRKTLKIKLMKEEKNEGNEGRKLRENERFDEKIEGRKGRKFGDMEEEDGGMWR